MIPETKNPNAIADSRIPFFAGNIELQSNKMIVAELTRNLAIAHIQIVDLKEQVFELRKAEAELQILKYGPRPDSVAGLPKHDPKP